CVCLPQSCTRQDIEANTELLRGVCSTRLDEVESFTLEDVRVQRTGGLPECFCEAQRLGAQVRFSLSLALGGRVRLIQLRPQQTHRSRDQPDSGRDEERCPQARRNPVRRRLRVEQPRREPRSALRRRTHPLVDAVRDTGEELPQVATLTLQFLEDTTQLCAWADGRVERLREFRLPTEVQHVRIGRREVVEVATESVRSTLRVLERRSEL